MFPFLNSWILVLVFGSCFLVLVSWILHPGSWLFVPGSKIRVTFPVPLLQMQHVPEQDMAHQSRGRLPKVLH